MRDEVRGIAEGDWVWVMVDGIKRTGQVLIVKGPYAKVAFSVGRNVKRMGVSREVVKIEDLKRV